MIFRDTFFFYKREYLHALRNGKSFSESAGQALERTREYFLQNAGRLSDIDKLDQWGTTLEWIIDWELVLRTIPIDIQRIPAKADMIRTDLETIKAQSE